jgi:queuosine biosynthesis protein QueC
MMRAVCLLSGGMDSSTLAFLAKSEGYGIIALHMNYGQRTEKKERACAKKIAQLLGAEDFIEVDIGYLSQAGASSLTDRAIAIEEFDPARADMPTTYVPFRNANLLSIATSFAEASSRPTTAGTLTADRSLSKRSSGQSIWAQRRPRTSRSWHRSSTWPRPRS